MTSTITPLKTRWETRAFDRQAAGSSLTVTTTGASYVGPSVRPGTGWQLPVGTGPGELAGIVHVTGTLSLGRGILPLYCLAFCYAEGVELAPGLRTGRIDLPEGWYPPAQVKALAQAAGLTFTTVEGLLTAEQLRKSYPRLIPHEGRWVAMVRLNEFLYALLGLALLVGGVVAAMTHRSLGLSIGAAVLGVVVLAVVVLTDPWVEGRRFHAWRQQDLRARQGGTESGQQDDRS